MIWSHLLISLNFYLFHFSLNFYGLKEFQLKLRVRLGYEKGSSFVAFLNEVVLHIWEN